MQFEQSSDIAHVVSTPEVHRARALVAAAAAVGVNNTVDGHGHMVIIGNGRREGRKGEGAG